MTALPPIIALLSISMFALSACGAILAGENHQFCENPNNFKFQVKTIANLKQASSSSVNRFQNLNQDSCLLVSTWPPQSSEAVLIEKRPVRSKKPNRLTRSIKPTLPKSVLDPVPTRCENLIEC